MAHTNNKYGKISPESGKDEEEETVLLFPWFTRAETQTVIVLSNISTAQVLSHAFE